MKFLIISLALLLAEGSLASPFQKAEAAIRKEMQPLPFDVGVSIHHLESGQTLSINGEQRTPMASVYKFPIGLVLLKKVEDGKVSLNEKIDIGPDDIRGGYKGPIAREYPKGGVRLSVSELLKLMVAKSDNSASDLLLKRVGGPKAATQVLRDWGFKNISIDRYEKALIQEANDTKNQNLDTASANEMVQIIKKFFKGELLSSPNTKMLKEFMTSPKTPGHIAKGLPQLTPQFHKSGWCAKNRCINDVALVTLPNGKGHLAVAILTSGKIQDTKAASQFIGRASSIAYGAATQ